MKILLVEDDHKIAAAIKSGLEQESHTIDVAFEGESGYDLASSEKFDVVVLDLMLPKMDGLTICKRLRKENNHVPILMLTAKGQVANRVLGLDSGADDYLPKPFAFNELLARIRAISRRPVQTISPVLDVSDLTLNTVTFEVTRNGKRIELSRKEFALLEYLMRHQGKILTKNQIIDHVWEYDADILPNTVEVYIGYLRNQIDKPFPKKSPLLITVRGFGYKIEE